MRGSSEGGDYVDTCWLFTRSHKVINHGSWSDVVQIMLVKIVVKTGTFSAGCR